MPTHSRGLFSMLWRFTWFPKHTVGTTFHGLPITFFLSSRVQSYTGSITKKELVTSQSSLLGATIFSERFLNNEGYGLSKYRKWWFLISSSESYVLHNAVLTWESLKRSVTIDAMSIGLPDFQHECLGTFILSDSTPILWRNKNSRISGSWTR